MRRRRSLSVQETQWYRRQSVLPEIGEAGQEQLAAARVLVIGAGGLGSPLLMYLAGAGLGTIGIVDFDFVEISNLHRQILHGIERLDMAKTESAERTLRGLNPHVTIRRHDEPIGPENAAELVRGYDVVADGSDNFATRDAVHAACLAARIPLVSAAVQLTDGLSASAPATGAGGYAGRPKGLRLVLSGAGYIMQTERISQRFVDLDAWDTAEALEAMLEGQMSAVAAVRAALPAITRAVDRAAATLGETGRLVYLGAGTSGRVAVQDGAELPPTFDWPMRRLMFAVAGGEGALISSVEGAEDDEADAVATLSAADLTAADVVIGVAASGTTPFTVAGVRHATTLGALTIGIANNPGAPLLEAATCPILVETGSELIAGSTRMKAGTAQKIVLNLISTGIMVRMGRIYRGMMVNMHVANVKLAKRAELIVSRIAGCDLASAQTALIEADGDMKVAALIVLGVDRQEAERKLIRNSGNLRQSLADLT